MKTTTVITRERRKSTSLVKLLNELLGDPTHSLYFEAEGAEQDVLLFRIYQLAGKLQVNLHIRTSATGVWVRSPKYAAANHISDEVRIAIMGIEGERQLCLLVKKVNAGVAELEAVETLPSACGGNPALKTRERSG
jgi:hypothetical protein